MSMNFLNVNYSPPSFEKNQIHGVVLNLEAESIESLEESCRHSTVHFTASRRKPKTVLTLQAITQRKNYPLFENKSKGLTKKMSKFKEKTKNIKICLFGKGLQPRRDFNKAIGVEELRSLNEFLNLTKTYIRHEEKLCANNFRKSRKWDPEEESSKKPNLEKKKQGGKAFTRKLRTNWSIS